MSENKRWDELPEHSYERYVAWCKVLNYSQMWCQSDWKNFTDLRLWDADWIAAKVNPLPLSTQNPTPNSTLRSNFLDEVKTMVCKDRAATHGDAEDNFNKIASLWNLFLGERLVAPLTSKDVAAFMIMVKLSRLTTTPSHIDHWHDIAGYAACGGGIVMKENKK